jgi:hypothetical protein
MVERFNGRISELCQQTRFASAAELEQTLKDYLLAYNHFLPQRAIGHRSPRRPHVMMLNTLKCLSDRFINGWNTTWAGVPFLRLFFGQWRCAPEGRTPSPALRAPSPAKRGRGIHRKDSPLLGLRDAAIHEAVPRPATPEPSAKPYGLPRA